MHYSIDCYVAIKGLPVKHQILAQRPIHAWHVAKTRFVTILPTEVLIAQENCHGCREELFTG